MEVVRETAVLRRILGGWRRAGAKVALVPTMGALHEGHLALVRHGREIAGRLVVSIFVNPAQFAPGEDFERYPRDEAGDLTRLEALGVDLAYLPDIGAMYAADHATWVVVEGPARGLCAEARPHFFRGVATVVAKLFNRVQPDLAIFGEKDYQQLLVVRRMVRDLDMPVEIVGHPTVREPDGLAMSSRNAYLSPEERRVAPELHRVLRDTAEALADGRPAAPLLAAARARLLAAGFTAVDYLEMRDAESLEPLEAVGTCPARLLAAARLGATRLIDNLAVAPVAGCEPNPFSR